MNIGKAAQKTRKSRMRTRETETRECKTPRGINFIDPGDEDCKGIIKNAKRKLETPVAPAMPCRRMTAKTSNRKPLH